MVDWIQRVGNVAAAFYLHEPDNKNVEFRSNEIREVIRKIQFNHYPWTHVKHYFQVRKQPDSDWLLSRFALIKCLEKFQGSQNTGICLSLSHTRGNSAFCAILPSNGSVLNVGVDLEEVSRTVSERAHLRISKNLSPELRALFSPLELWVAKEAVFKALSPLNRDISNTLSVEILKYDPQTGEGQAAYPKQKYQVFFKIQKNPVTLQGACLVLSADAAPIEFL